MSLGQEIMTDMLINDLLGEQNAKDMVRSKCWKAADGRVIPVKDMTESHIKNTIRWLSRNPYYYEADSFTRMLENELKNRG